MNEKIKEFMKKAGTDTSGKWMGVEHTEKFAELIAIECANVCEDYAAKVLKYSQFGSNGATDCANLIKEHFGINK